jgi:hypothetical protein
MVLSNKSLNYKISGKLSVFILYNFSNHRFEQKNRESDFSINIKYIVYKK